MAASGVLFPPPPAGEETDGFRVLRFSNDAVYEHLDGVLGAIALQLPPSAERAAFPFGGAGHFEKDVQ